MASWPGQRRETNSRLLSQHAKPYVKQHVIKQNKAMPKRLFAKAMSKQCTGKTSPGMITHTHAICISHDFHIPIYIYICVCVCLCVCVHSFHADFLAVLLKANSTSAIFALCPIPEPAHPQSLESRVCGKGTKTSKQNLLAVFCSGAVVVTFYRCIQAACCYWSTLSNGMPLD